MPDENGLLTEVEKDGIEKDVKAMADSISLKPEEAQADEHISSVVRSKLRLIISNTFEWLKMRWEQFDGVLFPLIDTDQILKPFYRHSFKYRHENGVSNITRFYVFGIRVYEGSDEHQV